MMDARGNDYLRGLYDLRYLFGDKWLPAILVALADGPRRRAEILSIVNSYSIGEEWLERPAVLHDSILARTLKKKTEQGVLLRDSCSDTFPPKVMYSLNSEICEFLRLLEPVIAWSGEHRDLIARAQAYSRTELNGGRHDRGRRDHRRGQHRSDHHDDSPVRDESYRPSGRRIA